jgi:transcriptional regulator with PAS, ATPase and Fis domain
MPRRKSLSGAASSATVHPDAQTNLQAILNDLDQLRTLTDPDARANLYKDLGFRYLALHMFGAAMQMFKHSLDANDSEQVRTELAKLHVHLLAAFDEARTLVAPLNSAFVFEKWIRRKQEAIVRRRRRQVLNHQAPPLAQLIGESQHIIDVCEQILTCARTSESVLITGPPGSGKELVAQAIHACSRQSKGRFIPLNCASIPDTLLESELFGYMPGAFTGAARKGKQGKFQLADKGTLFLDEVADLSLTAQAKILRATQEQEVEPLGGMQLIKINVRFIAATNKNLRQAIHDGQFRQDLYDRLNGVEITLKPLEDRLEDLQLLVRHFVDRYGTPQARDTLSWFDILSWVEARYLVDQRRTSAWSVRALENTVQRALAAGVRPAGAPIPRPPPGTLAQRGLTALGFEHHGDYPCIDFITTQVEEEYKEGIGPRCYTRQELDAYDTRIAYDLGAKQRDVAKLIGKSETWVSRHKVGKDTTRESTSRARERPNA